MAIKEAVEVIYTLADKTKAAFRSMHDNFDKASKKAKEAKKKLEELGRVGRTLAVVSGAISVAFGLLAKQSLALAGAAEQQRVAFKGLLGTYNEADEVIARIRKEAARTPFDIPGLTAMTQQLTTITKDGNRAVDILLDIGDAVAMSGKDVVEMQRVILNIQQVASTGKLTAMDIRQFQGAIPIFNDILAASGLTTTSLQKSANASELLFKAFKNAAQEGGLTFGGLASQSKTLNGLLSTTGDNIGGINRQLGEGLLPIVKPILAIFNKILDKFQNLNPVIKTMAAVSVTLTVAISGLAVAFGLVLALLPTINAMLITLGVTAAGTAISIGAVGTALAVAFFGIPLLIAGVVGGLILLKKAFDKLADNSENIKIAFLNTFDMIKIKINELVIGIVESLQKVADVLNKLPKVNIQINSSVDGLRQTNKEIEKQIKLRNELKELSDIEEARLSMQKKAGESASAIARKGEKDRKDAIQKQLDDEAEMEAARIAMQVKAGKASIDIASDAAEKKEALDNRYLGYIQANQADMQNAWKIGANAAIDVEKKKYITMIQLWMAKETAIATGLIASIVGIPEGLLRLLGVGAAGVGVAAINAIQLAKGGSMVVDSSTQLLGGRAIAGETGQKERITVQPLRRSDRNNGSSGGVTNLTVMIGDQKYTKKIMKSGYQGRSEGTINDGIRVN